MDSLKGSLAQNPHFFVDMETKKIRPVTCLSPIKLFIIVISSSDGTGIVTRSQPVGIASTEQLRVGPRIAFHIFIIVIPTTILLLLLSSSSSEE